MVENPPYSTDPVPCDLFLLMQPKTNSLAGNTQLSKGNHLGSTISTG